MWHSEFRHLHLPKKTSSQETRVLGITFIDWHVESPFKLKENGGNAVVFKCRNSEGQPSFEKPTFD
ncbi:hypothetical protein ECA02_04340 [Enterococcus casseliflavus]|nr:hypothetical protein ECA02_04340 [Enterococcus casseliflavus]